MPDDTDEPTVEPIHLTTRQLLTVDRWPTRTSVTEEFLLAPHVHHATLDGDTLTFRLGNGTARYALRRDLPREGQGIVADLVEGDAPGVLKRRAKKFEPDTGE